LNINAFACNFRYADGTVNKDISEANYLNRRIFERLSVTSAGEDPGSVPFYLTSTIFAQKDYGECASYFKKRLQLEGDGDLFVLRNVVMSPFSTTGNFVQKLADIFQQVLEEEVDRVRDRNTPKPGVHSFVMQGTDKIHLVHTPSFHMAGGRKQLIFTADVSEDALKRVKLVKEAYPNVPFILHNSEPALLSELVSGKSFKGFITIDNSSQPLAEIEVSNIQIIRKRSLDPEDLNSNYPNAFMPFYLYGTPEQQHIDHVLAFAPNAQFSAARVRLSLDTQLSEEDLAKGVIVKATNVRERSMQPFPETNKLPKGGKFFFSAGKEFTVEVCRDPFPAITDDSIDLDKVTEVITKGKLTLGPDLYIDTDKLNHEFHEEQVDTIAFRNHPSGHMSTKSKHSWVKKVDKHLYKA